MQGGVYGQHHSTVVYQEAEGGGGVLRCTQLGSATPLLVGGIIGAYSSSPIHHEDQERGGQLPEPSSTSAGFRVDPGSGVRERFADNVVSYRRSFCHSPQLPAPGLLFATERHGGSGHGCLSPTMRWPSGVCFHLLHSFARSGTSFGGARGPF